MRSRTQVLALAMAGAVAAASAQDGATVTKVEQCSKSFGTLAVSEPRQGWAHLSQYGLGSPAALLRMMVQRSGCFDVVERGVGMDALRQERALAAGGDLRQESNLGQGQMQAADFVMTPQVQIATQTTGGLGGALGGLSRSLGVLGAVAGALQFKEAQTSILVADVRSSLQVAAAEGKARATEFNLGGLGFAGGVGAALGGYDKTPEGRVLAASLLDNYNRIVLDIRERPGLIKPGSAAGDANAAASTRAAAPQRAGELLVPRLGNLRVHEQPSRESRVLATLQRGEEFIASGDVKDGFIHVDGANVSGWVQRTLVGPPAAGAAPAPVAPATPAPQSATPGLQPARTAAWPAAVPGTAFVGSFVGADQGSFQLRLRDDGALVGTGQSPGLGNFVMVGKIEADGSVLLAAGISPTASQAMFIGQVGGSRDMLSGNWQFTGQRQGNGTFSAQLRR